MRRRTGRTRSPFIINKDNNFFNSLKHHIMNKILRSSFAAFLVLLCGTAAAQTVTFEPQSDHSEENVKTITKEGITITITDGTLSRDDNYRCYKGATMTVTSTVGNVSKIELTATAADENKYGPGNFTTTTGNYTFEGKEGTWTGNASSVELTAKGAQVRMTKISVTTSSTPSELAAPVISGKEEFETTTEVTIEAQEGTTIYYTLDGSDPTTASTNGTSPVKFSIDKTTTVKAIAAKDGKISNIASKEFTKISFSDKTISDLHEMTEDLKNVNLNIKKGKVVYIDGKTAYVREGDKAIMFYNTSIPFNANAIVSGQVKVDYDNYFGIIEVKDNDFTNTDNLTITENAEEAQPTETTVTDILALKNISDYVVVKNVTISKDGNNIFVNDEEGNKVQLYKGIDASSYADNGKAYNVKALFNAIYKGAAEIQPVAIEEYVSDAINGIMEDTLDSNTPVYNLAGQRVSKNYKGVVIKNGKKFFNK